MIERKIYLDKIKSFKDKDIIKVLTGIRRSGKSVILKFLIEDFKKNNIKDEQIIYLNFENLKNKNLCNYESLNNFILDKSEKQKKMYLFLDEIQEVEAWEKCINSLKSSDNKFDIYLTGSNAKLLSSELSTYLAGRYIEFKIYPFSFKEFILAYNIEKEIKENDLSILFKKYIKLGGMPFLYNLDYKQEPSKQYLKDMYKSIIIKDISQRNNIRNIDLLDRIITYLIMNIANTFSATSISKFLKSENRKTSTETILNYIKMCEDAMLIHKVQRNDLIGKKILNIHEKYYISDHGIREALFENNERDINLVLENIIFIELLRRDYNIKIGKLNNLEIDFIATKSDKEKIYIQVAYLLASPETIEREFSVLEKIQDNYTKYVLSLDNFDMSRNGIIHKNIIDFLLEIK